MPSKPIWDELPALYKKFLPDLFNSHVPDEIFATCSDCAMVCNTTNQRVTQSLLSFSPNSKCCTFHPCLPNYLVGGLLSDPDPTMEEGKKRILDRIKNRTGVSPVGIIAPKLYMLKYANRVNSSFGNSTNLLCPYYEQKSGGCTIWKYREAVCSTWFCKTTAGNAGKDFYKSLSGYLTLAQTSLTKYTLLELDVPYVRSLMETQDANSPDYTKNISVEELDGLPASEKEYKNLWGKWYGKEVEFFKKCFELVNNLDEANFKNITGIEQQILLKELEARRANMVKLPAKLKKNPLRHLEKSADNKYIINLKTKSEVFEPQLEIPTFIINSFDGSQTNENVNKQLRESGGIEIDNEMLLVLYQHGILVEAK